MRIPTNSKGTGLTVQAQTRCAARTWVSQPWQLFLISQASLSKEAFGIKGRVLTVDLFYPRNIRANQRFLFDLLPERTPKGAPKYLKADYKQTSEDPRNQSLSPRLPRFGRTVATPSFGWGTHGYAKISSLAKLHTGTSFEGRNRTNLSDFNSCAR